MVFVTFVFRGAPKKPNLSRVRLLQKPPVHVQNNFSPRRRVPHGHTQPRCSAAPGGAGPPGVGGVFPWRGLLRGAFPRSSILQSFFFWSRVGGRGFGSRSTTPGLGQTRGPTKHNPKQDPAIMLDRGRRHGAVNISFFCSPMGWGRPFMAGGGKEGGGKKRKGKKRLMEGWATPYGFALRGLFRAGAFGPNSSAGGGGKGTKKAARFVRDDLYLLSDSLRKASYSAPGGAWGVCGWLGGAAEI